MKLCLIFTFLSTARGRHKVNRSQARSSWEKFGLCAPGETMWASRLAALTNGSVSKEIGDVKENQNSRNRNVLCSVVDVKQYYCLSYRMWKGTIRCVVPVLICSQDSHSILSSLSKGPYSVCLSLHCHSPPQKSPKFPVWLPLPHPHGRVPFELVIVGHFLPTHVRQGHSKTICAAKKGSNLSIILLL